MTALRVLSMWQPWAGLVAEGVKWIETRPYCAPDARIGDTIAIHATVGNTDHGLMQRIRDEVVVGPKAKFVYGAIICTVVLAESLPMTDKHMWDPKHLFIGGVDSLWIRDRGWADKPVPSDVDVTDQFRWGHFAPGRWAWIFTDVRKLAEPVPFIGGQGWSKTWEPT